jgi:RNA polymerase sigma factor (sigma-70 family)
MPGKTEKDIIEGCKNQDRTCQELLYRQYYSGMMKVCARYSRNMEDAEQLINDGFLKVFRNIGSYRDEGSFEGWARRIMVNNCLDYLRSKYLKSSAELYFNDSEKEESTPAKDADVLSAIAFKELVAMIQSLPPMTRTVFNLFVFDGFPHKEIAAMLDITEGTSFWHVNAARKLLKIKIRSMHPENSFYGKRI